ncbi:MAG: hypothetical protein KKD25_11455 [Gammaproteobacteria bacterium]|jgi:flagellar export protein FliJ|nr:hypothetical protein [Gammaproteobacteria bacterium]MBU0773488.1 hypothetical protein [Gammaproteobacteria bacterium]MBU0856698.1 hypothetical protein [Gammaproteobacteria bacterium]MBU1846772.1 hypothetical protein [Gammaproteobacteria bacterium]
MTQRTSIRTLARLMGVREREVDQLQSLMAGKEALRQRYLGNIERLQSLGDCARVTGAQQPLLSMNSANYKQAVAEMAQTQREALAEHDMEMDLARRDLAHASQRCEVIGQVLSRQRERVAVVARTKEQKAQDDLAVQVWRFAP